MEGEPQSDVFVAESFELSGEGLEVTYQHVPGRRGLRHMTVSDGSGEPRAYLGGEIQQEDTALGTLVTVVTSFAVDGDTHKLSVLLPGVNLSREPAADVKTAAIRTSDRGSIGGPMLIDGALSSYEAVALTGTARRGDHVSKPEIAYQWSAWYNRLPGADDPDLHVLGQLRLPSGSIQIHLEPANPGVVPDSKRFALKCTVKVPEVGTDDWVERDVQWQKDVGRGVETVEIRGDLEASVNVTIAQ